MTGYEIRLGLILAATNVVIEGDFYKMAPDGVSIHVTRMDNTKLPVKTSIERFIAMEEDMDKAAELMSLVGVDVIGYGCTSGTFTRGVEDDKEVIRRIEKKTGIPATTTSSSVVKALKELGITKLAFAGPYTKKVNDRGILFFEESGFKVVSINRLIKYLDDEYDAWGLGVIPSDSPEMTWNPTLRELSPSEAYRLAKIVDKPEANGIFISCTDFRAIEIIDKLEEDARKPVVTSNQALFWNMLRMAGFNRPIEGYGKLLTKT